MLNEFQTNRVWEGMLSAETRSLYFADLAAQYIRRKQWITGLSFFLASGAAATLVAKSPSWVPAVSTMIVAVLNAYSMSVNLDRSISTMVKLHCEWRQITSDYDRLWNHAHDDDAESKLDEVINSEKTPSELAVRDAPNNEQLLEKWEQRVFGLYHLTDEHG